MFNSVKKALGYREVYYNIKNKKYFTDAVGDQYAELPVVAGDDTTVELVTQTGRSANIFVDNATIAVIDSETIDSIPDANCYLLNKAPITSDQATLITSNAGENYYLYAYDDVYDETFPFAAELIVKLTKEEAAICSLSPYFTTNSGSIIEQAAVNYPFLMADRRELDKLRAAVAAYYLGQAYDNSTVLTKQAYWETALSAAISGSIVSTWKVLNDMATAAASNGVNISEAFLNDGYPTGAYYPPGGGVSNAYTRFLYYNNSVLNGNFTGYFNIGRINGAAKGISGGLKHYLKFDSAVSWAGSCSGPGLFTLQPPHDLRGNAGQTMELVLQFSRAGGSAGNASQLARVSQHPCGRDDRTSSPAGPRQLTRRLHRVHSGANPAWAWRRNVETQQRAV